MLKVKNVGKPDEGKLHVRFDEEGQVRPALYSIYMDVKTAVGSGSFNQVARRKAMDGEDILKTGMNKGRFGTVGLRRLFGHFLGEQKVPRRRNSGQ